MDFAFTDEQNMLRDGVERYLSREMDFDARRALVASDAPWSDDAWRHCADMGLLALPFAEDAGGLGGGIADVVAIAEPFGEALVVEPYLACVMLGGAALAAADGDRARALLDKVVLGVTFVTFGHEERGGTPDPAQVALRAEKVGDGYRLTGEKRLVLAGAQADRLVVSARTGGEPGSRGGVALFLVDPQADGVRLSPFVTIDGRSAAHVAFDGAAVPGDAMLLDDAADAIDRIVSDAIVALCAEGVGAMSALLRITAEYAATRKQFGVSIGSFQAIAHRLADMKIAVTKARATLLYTTALAEAGRAGPRDISVLKAQVGSLGRAVGEAAIQTHGGVGTTDELAVGHYHKRLLAIDAMFGDSEYHFRVVGAARAG